MNVHRVELDHPSTLGVPQSARDIFTLLATAKWIDAELATSLQKMLGFRNIAVHDYQTLQLPITIAVITKHLEDFLIYSQALLLKDQAPTPKQYVFMVLEQQQGTNLSPLAKN